MARRNDYDHFAFAKLYIEGCTDSPELPTFLRLWFAAVRGAKPNQHAEFKSGEIGRILNVRKRDIDTGIRLAVEYGLLDPASMETCLVLSVALVKIHDPNGIGVFTPCSTHGDGQVITRKAECEHTDRRHYARGLCEPCYRQARRA